MREPQSPASVRLRFQKGRAVASRYVGNNVEYAPVVTPQYLRGVGEAESAPVTDGAVLLRGDEIVLIWDGSNAGEFLRARRGILASTMVVLDHDRDAFDVDYLYYALKHFEPTLKHQTRGSGIPHVDKAVLLSYAVRRPDIREQAKIAEVLATIDQAIEQTEALIAKHKRVHDGMMHDLLTRGIDEQGRLRDPATHRFRSSPIGLVPEEWAVDNLPSRARADRPCIKTGPFGSALKTEDWRAHGVPVVTIGALGEGEIVDAELLYVSERKAQEMGAYIIEPGDLLFSRVADVGRSVVVGERERGWMMSSNLMRIALDPSRVAPSFAYHALVHERTRSQIRRLVNSSGREIANTEILKSLLLPWPDFSEQRRIVDIATGIRRELRDTERTLRKQIVLRAGLMQDLLTGRVAVEPLLAQAEQEVTVHDPLQRPTGRAPEA